MKINSDAKKITVFGAGAYGTALSILIARNNPENLINLWSYEKAVAVQINSSRKNLKYLNYASIPDNVYCTASINTASEKTDIFILALPAKFSAEILAKIKPDVTKDSIIIVSSKGLAVYKGKYMPVTIAARKIIGEKSNICVLTGPSNVHEIIEKKYSSFNFAQSSGYDDYDYIKFLFENDSFSIIKSKDVIAAELGGILKNPAAILFGILDGIKECGDNAKGIIFVKILDEIRTIFRFYKADENEILNLSCAGDLVASCFGEDNNNREYGRIVIEKINKKSQNRTIIGKIIKRIFKKRYHAPKFTVKNLLEGAFTIKPLIKIAEDNKLEIPVFKMLYEVLSENEDPVKIIETAVDTGIKKVSTKKKK